MNCTCENCGSQIEGDPPIRNRQGDFCGLPCYIAFLHEWPDLKSLPTEPQEPPKPTVTA